MTNEPNGAEALRRRLKDLREDMNDQLDLLGHTIDFIFPLGTICAEGDASPSEWNSSMNAHVKPQILVRSACPVADLADKIGALDVAYNQIDGATDERTGDQGRRLGELQDAIEHCSLQATWLTPTSPHGALLATLLLMSASRDLVEYVATYGSDAPKTCEAQRRIDRLSERLIEYLVAEDGRSVAEQGLSYFYSELRPCDEATAIVSRQHR